MALIKFICMHMWTQYELSNLKEPKYEFLIKNGEDAGIKQLNDPNAFIECSNTMEDVYENINDYNPSRKREILIVLNDMIY